MLSRRRKYLSRRLSRKVLKWFRHLRHTCVNNYLTTWKKNHEIKVIEKELGPDARRLMRRLFFFTKPNFEADKLTLDLPTGTDHTGDQSAVDADIDRLANAIDESDISEERIDFASIDEEPDGSSPTLEQQPPPLFIPPIQAPNQTSYIPAISLGNGCKAWPYCEDTSCRINNMKLCKKLGARLKVDEAFVREVTTASYKESSAATREKEKTILYFRWHIV